MSIKIKDDATVESATLMIASKNDEPFASEPDTIIIHYTAGSSARSSAQWLQQPAAKVRASAHVVIGKQGEIYQVVPFNKIAWHAGESAYGGRKSFNKFSIGIELDNPGFLTKTGDEYQASFGTKYPANQVIQAIHRNETSPRYWHIYTEEQIAKCDELCQALIAKYPSITQILGHEESCLNKLIRQALEAGIIQQAKVNAEETLKNFFSLLIDEPLDKVVIMKNSLAEYQASLLAKPVLTIDRLPLIDSVLVYLDNVDSATAVETVIKLNEKKFKVDRDTFPLTRYSALAYRIAEDKLITTQEWSEVNKVMKSNILTHLDSIWFFPYKEYKSITKSATTQAREQSKYEAIGLRYWADSVRSKASYILFKNTTDSLKMQQLKKVMATNRTQAKDKSIDLMKRYVNTIRVEQTEMNDAVKVTAMFNELKN